MSTSTQNGPTYTITLTSGFHTFGDYPAVTLPTRDMDHDVTGDDDRKDRFAMTYGFDNCYRSPFNTDDLTVTYNRGNGDPDSHTRL